jgi:methylglyoxal/glyoxal reductase
MMNVPSDVDYNSGRQVWKGIRPATKTAEEQPTLYLYHVVVNSFEGLARWVIGTHIGSKTHAVAYIDSWSVTPQTAMHLNDNAQVPDRYWQMQKPVVVGKENQQQDGLGDTRFEHAPNVQVDCLDNNDDNTIWFESSSTYQPKLSGFYVETVISPGFRKGLKTVYAKIRSNHNEVPLYMYKYNDDSWLIGEKPNVDSALAFHDDAEDAVTPGDISYHHWRYIREAHISGTETWVWDYGVIVGIHNQYKHIDDKLSKMVNANIYDAYHYFRSIKFIPKGTTYMSLRNNVPLPQLGLGTGGIMQEDLYDIATAAIDIGYRTFDLAREYHNEYIIKDIIRDTTNRKNNPILRQDVFLISKLWPTHLGFETTVNEIAASLWEMGTTYIDMYLLHWPKCDYNIEWMHCKDTIDPNGTWRESWRGLEKEYSEGRVVSIGVSNFNKDLLKEMESFALILPQLVQNHGELTENGLDKDVRLWCNDRNVAYMPYAHQRNLRYLPQSVHEILDQLSEMHDKSKHNIASKFFIQSGAAVIPRSSNIQHLRDNANIFSYELAHADMRELGWNHIEMNPVKIQNNELYSVEKEQLRWEHIPHTDEL